MNLSFVSALLDLDSFVGSIDLSQAEAVLLENLEVAWQVAETRFLLVVVTARQGSLSEARSRLAEALETISLPETNRAKINRLDAEVELALAEKRWDQAIAAFQSRIEIFSNAGFRRQLARDLLRLGDAYRLRGKPGDHEGALETYRQALDMFTEMDAPGYKAAAATRLQKMEQDASSRS